MVLSLLALCALAQPPPADADAWVARLLTHTTAWEDFRHQGEGGWHTRHVVETLGRDGHVEETQTEWFESVRVEGRTFARLLARNGAPPPAEELRKQAQQEADLARKTREARARNRELPEDEDHVSFDATFLRRFVFAVAGRETRAGRDCVMLDFRGKQEGGLTLRPQEVILRRLQGRLWLSADDGALVHLDASLPQPVTVGLIAVRVESLSLSYDQQQGPNGLWVPAHYEMTLHGRAFLKRMDTHEVAAWTF